MKLSVETVNLLKNFATINASIFISKGNRIATKSLANNIAAYAEVAEEFEVEFGIYEVSGFLSVYGMMTDPELNFKEGYVEIVSGTSKCHYNYCAPDIVIRPKNCDGVKLPSEDVKFELTEGNLDKIIKISNTLSLEDICIHNVEGRLLLTVIDSRSSGSNRFSIDVGESTHENSFEFFIKAGNLKIEKKDNYSITISQKGITEFKGTKCTYNITLEKKGQKW
jgi:hypothetical protein|tara:strand:- start:772 stop:1440 length:669 start_codon:yes stop_codon:yes gene_type:complete